MASNRLRFLLILYVFWLSNLAICQLIPGQVDIEVTEAVPILAERDYDVNVTPTVDNLLQRIRNIMRKIRISGKNAIKHLAGATVVTEYNEIESRPTTPSSVDSTMRRPVLHRIREHMKRRRMGTTTTLAPLQRYGALSAKFQEPDDEGILPVEGNVR